MITSHRKTFNQVHKKKKFFLTPHKERGRNIFLLTLLPYSKNIIQNMKFWDNKL